MIGFPGRIFVTVGVALTFLAVTAGAAAAPPTIGAQWVTEVTQDDASLNAEINPSGLPTAYELQIDTTGRFRFYERGGGCPLSGVQMICTAAEAPGDPLPPGLVQPPEFMLPAVDEGRHVSVEMASIGATLQPGTTYRFRAIASNGWTVVEGATQTFTTLADPSPPAGPGIAVASGPSADEAEKRGTRRKARRCRAKHPARGKKLGGPGKKRGPCRR
jgi:hypothetical protein